VLSETGATSADLRRVGMDLVRKITINTAVVKLEIDGGAD